MTELEKRTFELKIKGHTFSEIALIVHEERITNTKKRPLPARSIEYAYQSCREKILRSALGKPLRRSVERWIDSLDLTALTGSFFREFINNRPN